MFLNYFFKRQVIYFYFDLFDFFRCLNASLDQIVFTVVLSALLVKYVFLDSSGPIVDTLLNDAGKLLTNLFKFLFFHLEKNLARFCISSDIFVFDC